MKKLRLPRDTLRESDIEKRLVRKVENTLHGKAYKFTSPGRRSVPDRLILLHGPFVCFTELKRPGETPTPLQQKEIDRLREMGFEVYVLDTYDAVDEWIAMMFERHVDL